jgi:flagellar hook-associated protein 3 FlgL
MIRSIDPSSDNFLLDIGRLQSRIDRAQQQISSGLRVIKPSDDPDAVGAIVTTGADVARNSQIGHNLDRVKGEVDGSEAALSTGITTLEQVRVIAAQGANFDQTAATRNGLATQVANLLERLVANANTTIEGRYVFSGDSDQAEAYQVDLTTATGTGVYAGTPATRQAQDPRGGTFPTSQTAQEIFDAPGAASVFGAVNALRVALLADDQTAITASLAGIETAHDHLSDSLAFYGSVQNQVDDAVSAVKASGLRLTSSLSDIRDADLAEATSDLVSAQTQLQATFSARARVPRNSLFDYLG